LYEALSGMHPFRGATAISTSDRTLHEEPRELALLDRSLPPELSRITARLLAKKAEARYQDAKEVAATLRALEFAAPRAASKSLAARLVGIVLLLGVLAGLGLLLFALRRRPPAQPASAVAALESAPNNDYQAQAA